MNILYRHIFIELRTREMLIWGWGVFMLIVSEFFPQREGWAAVFWSTDEQDVKQLTQSWPVEGCKGPAFCSQVRHWLLFLKEQQLKIRSTVSGWNNESRDRIPTFICVQYQYLLKGTHHRRPSTTKWTWGPILVEINHFIYPAKMMLTKWNLNELGLFLVDRDYEWTK